MDSSRPQNPTAPAASQPSDPVGSRPETRAERLARIRREIEAGTYETSEKLELAIDRMMGILAD